MFYSFNYFPDVSEKLNWAMVRQYLQSPNADLTHFRRSQFKEIKKINDLIEQNHKRLWIWVVNRLQSQISYLEHRSWSWAQEPLVRLENSMQAKDFMLSMSNVEVAIDTHRMLRTVDETWRLVDEIRLIASGPERETMISFHSTLQIMVEVQPAVPLISELIELHKPLIEEVHRIAISNRDEYDWKAFREEFTTPDDWTMEQFQTWCDTLESHRIPADG